MSRTLVMRLLPALLAVLCLALLLPESSWARRSPFSECPLGTPEDVPEEECNKNSASGGAADQGKVTVDKTVSTADESGAVKLPPGAIIQPQAPQAAPEASTPSAVGECTCAKVTAIKNWRKKSVPVGWMIDCAGVDIDAICGRSSPSEHATGKTLPPPGESLPETPVGQPSTAAPADQPPPLISAIPGWSSPPPPGVGRVGAVPGPATMGQTIVGVVLPGLGIILGGLLGGLLRNPPPTNIPQPAPAGGADEAARAAAEAEARAAAERQADWLKQREEDLRQVREQKSFIAATAAGARQGGFDASEHDRQMEELSRRERELTTQISSAGGDSSYVATTRDTVKVGAGFTEANRIAQEFDRQQAIAAARAKLEELEKARQQAERDYWKDVKQGFWTNTAKDVDAIPGQLKDAAKAGLRTIGTVVHDVGKAIADGSNWQAAGEAAVQTIKDIVGSPLRSARKMADFYGDVASTAAAAGAHIVTHPVDTIKAIAGVDNWEKAFDPNVPVTERMGRALVGVFDAATNIAGVGATLKAAKAAKAADAAVDIAKVADKAIDLEKGASAGKATQRGAMAEGLPDRIKSNLLAEEREKAWQEGKQAGRTAIDKAHAAVESKDPRQLRDAALGLQENKHSLYDVNRQTGAKAAETRQAMKTEIQKIYDETDDKVCRELNQKYLEVNKDGGIYNPEVRPKSITNAPKPGDPPRDPTKMSIDRDVTFERKAKPGEFIPDPERAGHFIRAEGGEWVDIPARNSGAIYNEKFKETALAGASPETRAKYEHMTADEFGRHMDQTVTDRLANDAYGRGVSDLRTAVEDPAGKFSDPSGIARTSEFKAHEWYEQADHAKTTLERETCIAEGMRQTSKQFGNQIENRLKILNQYRGEGSANPGIPAITPPGELKKGIEILKEVADGKISPAMADAQLASIGMKREDVAHNLGDFLDKIYRMPVQP